MKAIAPPLDAEFPLNIHPCIVIPTVSDIRAGFSYTIGGGVIGVLGLSSGSVLWNLIDPPYPFVPP